MASVNKVILVGNLGRDPEIRYTAAGDAIANLAVATSETWKDKNTGEKKELTEWHRVVVYKKLAEICGEYLKKGASVYLEGRLKTRKWTDKENVERYTTEVECDVMQMLGGRPTARQDDDVAPREPARTPAARPASTTSAASHASAQDDDIPW